MVAAMAAAMAAATAACLLAVAEHGAEVEGRVLDHGGKLHLGRNVRHLG